MKSRKSISKLIVLLLLCLSCSDKQPDDSWSMNQATRSFKVLKDLINKGDIGAYIELSHTCLDFGHGEFLPFALIMADKYNYPQAYYDVYFELLQDTHDPTTTLSLDSCDKKTREKAINYLKLAYEKGFEPAGEELGRLYNEGKFLPQDTILGKRLIQISDSIQDIIMSKNK